MIHRLGYHDASQLSCPENKKSQRKECTSLLIGAFLDGEPLLNLSHKGLTKFVMQLRCIRFR